MTPVTHVIVDEEGVMLDVVTEVSPPYVVLLMTHGQDGRPASVFGLDAPAARRLAQRLTAAADDAPEFDPAVASTYPCATRRDCGCTDTGLRSCPGRDA